MRDRIESADLIQGLLGLNVTSAVDRKVIDAIDWEGDYPIVNHDGEIVGILSQDDEDVLDFIVCRWDEEKQNFVHDEQLGDCVMSLDDWEK